MIWAFIVLLLLVMGWDEERKSVWIWPNLPNIKGNKIGQKRNNSFFVKKIVRPRCMDTLAHNHHFNHWTTTILCLRHMTRTINYEPKEIIIKIIKNGTMELVLLQPTLQWSSFVECWDVDKMSNGRDVDKKAVWSKCWFCNKWWVHWFSLGHTNKYFHFMLWKMSKILVYLGTTRANKIWITTHNHGFLVKNRWDI